MNGARMRIFVPACLADLATLHRDGTFTAVSGFALTDRYRAAVGAEIADDDEVLDYDLLTAAADASLDGQTGAEGPTPPRRVVIAVDAPARPDPSDPGAGRVLVEGPIELSDVASVHVDDAGADPVTDPDADLAWYAPQEIADLLAG